MQAALVMRAQGTLERMRLQVLRDPELRTAHDAALAAQALQSGMLVYDEVPAADMDLEGAWLSHPCRCGGSYTMDVAASHSCAVLLPCSTCSLHLQVLPAQPSETCKQEPPCG